MTELRLTGKTEDGLHLALTTQDGTSEFTLRISDTLRATVNQPRLVPVVDTDENVMSVKEIQKRLRAGESMEVIAREGRISVDKVERFASPILQERSYILAQVHQLPIRKDHGHGPQTFEEVVISKLVPRGVDSEAITWNTWRLDDGTWNIEVRFPNSAGQGEGHWVYDSSRRSIESLDDNAAWLIDAEKAPRRSEPGLIYSEPAHPSRLVERDVARNDDSTESHDEPIRETPRLVAIRETPAPADSQDGITARAKVPSWDEIMFGRAAKPTNNEDDTLL